MSTGLIFRLVQLCVFLYVLAAVIFTTCVYVLAPVSGFLWSRTRRIPSPSLTRYVSNNAPVQRSSASFHDPQEMYLGLSELVGPLGDSHWADNWPSGYTSSELLYLPRTEGHSGRILEKNGFGIREETLLCLGSGCVGLVWEIPKQTDECGMLAAEYRFRSVILVKRDRPVRTAPRASSV